MATFREVLQNEKSWHKKALIIELFHNRMLLRHKKWNMRKTAEALAISLTAVSQAVKLAKHVKAMPTLKEIPTREKALEFVRNL